MIPQAILNLASKYGVTITRDSVNCSPNEGACAGKDIYLGKFDDPDIELVAFFHELGHTRISRGTTMSKISGEGAAWEMGLELAFVEGFKWDYYSKEMVWARGKLNSYLNPEWTRELTRNK